MNKQKKLVILKQKMLKDESLPLKGGATNLVFGQGNPEAKVMFIGEGPGYWEDQKALPFVGNAGAFLNQLLYSIKLPRKEVFITNVVHHRPPGNRDPLPKELAAYRPYLDRMIEIIEPEVIVTLGRFSMAKFIAGVTITSVHGKPRKIDWKGRGVMLIPMYHPAAALRSAEIKRRSIEDFKIIPEVLKKANSPVAKEKSNTRQMKLV